MREVNYIVVHCTATSQTAKVESIKRYWREKLGWKSTGYHYIIAADGTETQLANLTQITNGVKGHNANSVHICYIGGVDSNGKPIDNRTEAQKFQMLKRIKYLKGLFPRAEIKGHRDFPNVSKACPCFDAIEEYSEL